jgi:hypothetical protein
VTLVALAVFAVVMALLPQGPAALAALGGVLGQPVVQLLLLVATLGYVPRWFRKKD